MKVTPTFLYPIFGLETTTACPGCGLGTKLHLHNFVVVPRFTTRVFEAEVVYIFFFVDVLKKNVHLH